MLIKLFIWKSSKKFLDTKNNEWHAYINSNSLNIPPNFHYSLVFKMTTVEYGRVATKHFSQKVHISPESVDNYPEARRAIAGITHLYGRPVALTAEIATNGLIKVDESYYED
jgi:hypothetical protein